MQTIVSESAPFDDVLLSEENVTITSSRLEIDNTTYALKYVVTVTLSETHPPRDEARLVVILGIIALLAVAVYSILGKMTITGFLIYFTLGLFALLIGAMVYWLDPSLYSLHLKLINGESVDISNKSERFIHRVHQALSVSLAQEREATVGINRATPMPAAGFANGVATVHSIDNGLMD